MFVCLHNQGFPINWTNLEKIVAQKCNQSPFKTHFHNQGFSINWANLEKIVVQIEISLIAI